ncbi:MAG: hypothetical protein Q8914_00800 [Bacteroidota bacterium]|nr:hypothetical protein [Bacteroidota bacterium]
MEKDSALRNVLKRKSGDLPYGFDQKLMEQILLEAEKKSRRNELRNLVLVAAVSVSMIAGALLALYHYFLFNFLKLFSGIPERLFSLGQLSDTGMAFAFYGYIALAMMVLLALDHLFRRRLKKPL